MPEIVQLPKREYIQDGRLVHKPRCPECDTLMRRLYDRQDDRFAGLDDFRCPSCSAIARLI